MLYDKFHDSIVFILNMLGCKIGNKHNLNNHDIQNYICVIIYNFEICEVVNLVTDVFESV